MEIKVRKKWPKKRIVDNIFDQNNTNIIKFNRVPSNLNQTLFVLVIQI